MKRTSMRAAMIVCALACMGARVAPASALVAGALTLGLHADDHAHTVTLVVDENHVDVVVSHVEPVDDAAHPHGDPEASGSDDAHVLHLSEDDAALTGPRRDGVSIGHVVSPRALYLPRLESATRSIPFPQRRVRPFETSKTIVLRV